MRFILRISIAVVAVVLFAATAGTFVPRPLFALDRSGSSAETRRILLLPNPIHTDIAIPLDEETRADYAFLEASGIPIADPVAQWLVLGWGGRAFYLETPTWSDLKPMPVFRALTVDRSVMHVDVTGSIDETRPAIRSFNLPPAEFQTLSNFIKASFVRDRGEIVAIPDAGYGAYDQFFEAHGSFNALLGCNTWTAQALRSAGIRTGWWNPLPQTLGLSLRLFN
ncbi:hypothetical protein D3C80_318360 [compost metagenome]